MDKDEKISALEKALAESDEKCQKAYKALDRRNNKIDRLVSLIRDLCKE